MYGEDAHLEAAYEERYELPDYMGGFDADYDACDFDEFEYDEDDEMDNPLFEAYVY